VRDRVCIVGIGETEYRPWGRITDRSEFQLACEAVLAACADAGLSARALDGFASYANDRNDAPRLAAALGCAELRFSGMVWDGGGGGVCAAVAHAASAIHAGAAECVAVVRALCQGEYGRFGRVGGRAPARQAPGSGVPPAFAYTLPFGLLSPAAMCALFVRRHMHKFGTTHRQMGHVAVAARTHANRNPRAVMYGRPLTLEEHAAARPIADPFRLYDCCLETDGACALVLVSAERAHDLRRRPVHILAAAEGGEGSFGASLYTHAAPVYPSANAAPVARRLWAMAGSGPEDMDVAQIYENFSGMVLLALEDYGFCPRGEGGPFVEDGKLLGPDGALPLNTAGGNLSEAYVHGLNLVVEGVRQMRGKSTCQVPGAELCLVAGAPGVAPTSALVLRRG
jgi:acetyl-CoA acetyltransferase